MSKLTNISGFPEWLPEEKLIEDELITQIKAVYLSHGFTPIETPSVELISTLASKGVVDKEIYAVKRLKSDSDDEAELGLHFDLTVPLARYVAQHFSKLSFPFRRYQLQKSWRGDRPQRGRFREFYQFDIDIIAQDSLPISCDAEVVEVLTEAFTAINLGRFRLRVNNRKLLLGSYSSLGLGDAKRKAAIVVVDKLDKIGPDGVLESLRKEVGLNDSQARKILDLAQLRFTGLEAAAKLNQLGINDELFAAGVSELTELISLLSAETAALLEIDLSLARGLEYYTGLIVEVHLTDHPEFGSAAGGGRYDDLASQFINKKLPGVGVSIGLTRLMDLILSKNVKQLNRRSPSEVLVTVLSEAGRPQANELARKLRAAGVNSEVYFKSPKLGKQIEYAEARGIPYVFFLGEGGLKVEVKDLKTKTQQPVSDLAMWVRATYQSPGPK